MAHLTSFEFCPVFDKNRTKVRLCVCSGVLVMVTYGHDRFFVTVTSRMDIIHDVTKWAVHLCLQKGSLIGPNVPSSNSPVLHNSGMISPTRLAISSYV